MAIVLQNIYYFTGKTHTIYCNHSQIISDIGDSIISIIRFNTKPDNTITDICNNLAIITRNSACLIGKVIDMTWFSGWEDRNTQLLAVDLD